MEAWNSGVITTWGQPLFGPRPLQRNTNVMRHKLGCAQRQSQLADPTFQAASCGYTMLLFICPTHPPTGSVPVKVRYSQYEVGVRWPMGNHRRPNISYLPLPSLHPLTLRDYGPDRVRPNLPFLSRTHSGRLANGQTETYR
jgi:hypothetical protein